MKLIVGLGNPGQEYAKTRHNIGFVALDHLCYSYDLKWSEKARFKSEIAEGEIDGERVLLAKPTTFMNHAGEAMRALVDFYNIRHGDVLVIHDDADMDYGKARVVQGGNDGGHRGVASLFQHGFEDVRRLKVGVSNEHRQPGQAIDFVLRRFEASEWDALTHLMPVISKKADEFVEGSLKAESFTWH